MVSNVGGEGAWEQRARRLADRVDQEPPEKDSQKHLLVTHSFQSITQRAARRNKDSDRRHSDLRRLIHTVLAVSTRLVRLSH